MGNRVCSGCGACVAICPKKCLSLVMNSEGFLIVSDRGEGCLSCGLCEKVCPFLHEISGQRVLSRAGYFVAADDALRLSSSSGGVCGILAEASLSEGRPVCGAVYDVSDNKVRHAVARTVDEAVRFRGSKYLQSDPSVIYALLDEGDCMVTGTPCQIAGARRYAEIKHLKGSYWFVDFYCHGVPSYRLWSRYFGDLGFDKVAEVRFRDKEAYGWEDWTIRIVHTIRSELPNLMDDYISSFRRDEDFFYAGFLSNACLNKPCYLACPFRGTISLADIRVGDSWGHDVAGDNMGTSVVLAFGKRGFKLLGHLEASGSFIDEHVEVAASAQMSEGPSLPKCRDRFIADLGNPSVSQEQMKRRYIRPEQRMKVWRARWRRVVNAVEKIFERKGGGNRV